MEHCRKSINLLFTDKLQTVSEPKVPNQSESSQLKLHISFSIRASVMLAVQLSKNHKLVMFYQEKNAAMFFVLFFDQNQLLYVFLRMSFNIAEISADVKPSQTSMKSHMCSIVLDQHEICTLQVTILTFTSFCYVKN